eukprot:gene10560-12934_t
MITRVNAAVKAFVTTPPCRAPRLAARAAVAAGRRFVSPIDDELVKRIHRDLQDDFDEELELELEDRNYGEAPGDAPAEAAIERRRYFRELFRLQSELVKLQDWVQHSGHKVVILFEGRDAAGKGGVIKRITQRLNPRVCRV